MLAAVAGLLLVHHKFGTQYGVLHYIDSTVALSVIIKGSSKHRDLNAMAGYTWLMAAELRAQYWAQYVPSSSNLADGPSRNQHQLMTDLWAQEVEFELPSLGPMLDSWMDVQDASRLVS